MIAQHLYNPHGHRQDQNLVESLQEGLRDDQHRYFIPCKDAAESHREEDHRINPLAPQRRHDGPQRKAASVRGSLHARHHISIDHRATQEGNETGREDARDSPEDHLHSLLALPRRRSWKPDAELQQQRDKKIHPEAEPDDKTRLAEAIDLDYTVIENIGDRKDHHARGYGERTQIHSLYLHQIADYQADAERHRKQHESH